MYFRSSRNIAFSNARWHQYWNWHPRAGRTKELDARNLNKARRSVGKAKFDLIPGSQPGISTKAGGENQASALDVEGLGDCEQAHGLILAGTNAVCKKEHDK